METYSYKCPACGFIHKVPAYWMSYSAEETTDFMHLNPAADEPCTNETLEFIGEE